MLYTLWGDRSKVGDTPVVSLFDDAKHTIATFPISTNGEATATGPGDTQWKITGDKTHLAASLPTGQQFNAQTVSKPFGRAATIDIDLDGMKVQAINETGSNWVYVNEQDEELGQFSGGNNGVRKAITEFVPTAELTTEQKVFLSWVTRTTLEAKTMFSTLILTLCLLLVIPIVIFGLL